MRSTEAPAGMTAAQYTQLLQQLVSAGAGPTTTINDLTAYICGLDPTDVTDLERRFSERFGRSNDCLFTELNDRRQQSALRDAARRMPGEPDLRPLMANLVCRKPSTEWRANEYALMQTQACPSGPWPVEELVDAVAITRADAADRDLSAFFLAGLQRVAPSTTEHTPPGTSTFGFAPAMRIDTVVLRGMRSLRGARVEVRLRSAVVATHRVDTDELVVIIPLHSAAAPTAEGFTSCRPPSARPRRCGGRPTAARPIVVLMLLLLPLLVLALLLVVS